LALALPLVREAIEIDVTVEFEHPKVAHAGAVSAASPLGSEKRRDWLGCSCHVDIYDITN
jgi:hypothetical protein